MHNGISYYRIHESFNEIHWLVSEEFAGRGCLPFWNSSLDMGNHKNDLSARSKNKIGDAQWHYLLKNRCKVGWNSLTDFSGVADKRCILVTFSYNNIIEITKSFAWYGKPQKIIYSKK